MNQCFYVTLCVMLTGTIEDMTFRGKGIQDALLEG